MIQSGNEWVLLRHYGNIPYKWHYLEANDYYNLPRDPNWEVFGWYLDKSSCLEAMDEYDMALLNKSSHGQYQLGNYKTRTFSLWLRKQDGETSYGQAARWWRADKDFPWGKDIDVLYEYLVDSGKCEVYLEALDEACQAFNRK